MDMIGDKLKSIVILAVGIIICYIFMLALMNPFKDMVAVSNTEFAATNATGTLALSGYVINS